MLLGIFTGTVAAIYGRPLQRNAANYNAFFRKPWMKLPIYSFFFVCGYYGGIQLPYRFFPKLSPSTN
jgi:H+/Cl- antiporter ClcA